MIRKIQTQKEIERAKRKKQVIIGGILILIMVVSTAGYAIISSIDGQKSKVEFNGVEFERSNGLWKFEIGGQEFYVQNLPQSLKNVSVNGSFSVADYINKPLYIVGGSSSEVSELINFLGRYVLRYQEACLLEENCSKDVPVKDCTNNIVAFVQSNVTKVYKNESCVFIEGDFLKGVDAFIYRMLGVGDGSKK
ncbi:hypothetical protein D6745_00935 [Candidatus Woesearchaeota archaeon]|nr:MAG: hypothetical protein D6745_00935 [Candidatus Woesearchaeota archaeon]